MPMPTPEEIREAGRQLQRGGILGTGSKKKADKVVEDAVAAGADRQAIAMQVLSAANYEPRRWAR